MFWLQIILTVYLCICVIASLVRMIASEPENKSVIAGCVTGFIVKLALYFGLLCYVWHWFNL